MRGPRTVCCGTPEVTGTGSDISHQEQLSDLCMIEAFSSLRFKEPSQKLARLGQNLQNNPLIGGLPAVEILINDL